MTRDIKITVKGVQWDDTGNRDSTEITASGEYYFRNGSHYIFYEETGGDSGERVKNSLKLKGNLLELNKKGMVNGRMVFETGKRHVTDYATPYGILRMETETSRIGLSEEAEGIRITLEYELWMEQTRISVCELTMKLECAK